MAARYRDETDRRRRIPPQYYADAPPEWNMRNYGPPGHSTSYDSGRALHRPEERPSRRPKGRRASNEARSEYTMAPPPMGAPIRGSRIIQQSSMVEPPTYYEPEGAGRSYVPRRHSMRDEYHERRPRRRTAESARHPPDILQEDSSENSSDDDDDDDDDEDEDDDDEEDEESSEDSNIPERESEADDEASSTKREQRAIHSLSDSSDDTDDDDELDDHVDVKRKIRPGRRRQRPNPSSSSDEESPSPMPPKKLTAPPRRSMTVVDNYPTPKAIEAASPPPRAMTGPFPQASSTRATGVLADPRLQMSPKRLSRQREATFPDARQDSSHQRSRKSTSSRGSLRSSNVQSSVLDGMRSSNSLSMTPERRKAREHRRERHRDGKHHKHVECVVCQKDKPVTGVTKLDCGHRMCKSCLHRKFELAATDQLHMPPQCCSNNPIPLKHVEALFDESLKLLWNRRYSDYTTYHRLYCPSKRCMEWIKPARISVEGNRECATCEFCDMKVCVACNGKWHITPDCPNNEETKRTLRQAKENPKLRCFWCTAKVDRVPDTNHTICECGVELCTLCGSKKGYCECQLFELGPDGGQDMDLALSTDDVFETSGGPIIVRERTRKPENDRSKRRARRRTHEDGTYHRGLLEDDLARRFTSDLTLHEEPSDIDEDVVEDGPGSIGLGISTTSPKRGHKKRGAGKHRTMAASAPAAPPPAPEPPKRRSVERLERMERVEAYAPSQQSKSYDRESYVADMHRARGPRVGSMERRLADRFGGDPRQGVSTRADMPPGPPGPPPMSPSMMMPGAPAPPPPMGPAPPYNNMGMPMRMPPPGTAPVMMPPMPPPPFGSPSYGHSYGPPPTASMDHVPVMEPDHRRRHGDESVPRSSSQMAGLEGSGGGMDRVKEWQKFVKPGRPEEGGGVVG